MCTLSSRPNTTLHTTMKTVVHKTRRRGGGLFTNKLKQVFTRKQSPPHMMRHLPSAIAKCTIEDIPAGESIHCMTQVYLATIKYVDVANKVCMYANAIEVKYHVVDIKLCTYCRQFGSTGKTVAMITYVRRGKKGTHKKGVLPIIQCTTYGVPHKSALPQIIKYYLYQHHTNKIKMVGLNCDAYNSSVSVFFITKSDNPKMGQP